MDCIDNFATSLYYTIPWQLTQGQYILYGSVQTFSSECYLIYMYKYFIIMSSSNSVITFRCDSFMADVQKMSSILLILVITQWQEKLE